MKTPVFNYTADKDCIYPTSTLAAQYIRQNMPDCKKVHFIGTPAMEAELNSNGLDTTGGQNDPYLSKWNNDSSFKYEDIENFEFDPEVGAVVVGLDWKVNYSKMVIASLYL